MLNITTVDKRSQTKTGGLSDRVLIARPSVVLVEVARAEVVSVERAGQDAIIRLKNGQTVLLQGFFNPDRTGLISDLVFTEPGVPLAWWSNPLQDWAMARVEQIPAVDALLLPQEAALPVAAIGGGLSGGAALGGVALLGAVAAGGGGGGGGGGGTTVPPASGGSTPTPVDTTRPTAQISVSDSRLSLRESIEVTLRFSEPVIGLTLSDLQVAGGTVSNLRAQGDGLTFVVTFTQDGSATTPQIRLVAGGVSDTAGNTNLEVVFGAAEGLSLDSSAPTATILLSRTQLQAGETAVVTITFSEAVNGFTLEDLRAENAVLSNLVQSLINPLVYTATLTANAGVTDATNLVSLTAASYTDAAGNGGAAAAGPNYEVRQSAPQQTVTLFGVLDDVDPVTGTVGRDGITNDSRPLVTGSLSAPLVAGQLLEVFAGGTRLGAATVSGTQWSFQTDALADGLYEFTARVFDPASNLAGAAASPLSITVDTRGPAADEALIEIDAAVLRAGETATVTITFLSPITGFELADLVAENATLSNLSAPMVNGDGTVSYTATLTPRANVNDTSNVVTLQAGSYADRAGNPGAAIVSGNYEVQTIGAPTQTVIVSAVSDDVAPGLGAVAAGGFTNDRRPTVSGSISAGLVTGQVLEVLDGDTVLGVATVQGTSWTFTPAQDLSDGLVSLTARVSDSRNNQRGATSNAIEFTVDSVAPATPTITLSDTALTVGETAVVTISFSEPVTGFDLSDLRAENGTLSALSAPISNADGSVRYTATFTPTANINDATNVVTLAADSAGDRAGNLVPGGVSANYTVNTVSGGGGGGGGAGGGGAGGGTADTTPPAAPTITLSDTILSAGEKAIVTIRFAEPILGLTASDFLVENGSLGPLSQPITGADGSVTYTAELTPSANVVDATNVIRLQAGSYTDRAGNAGPTAVSANYEVRTGAMAATGDSGFVADGYLRGAQVFRDLDGDGLRDADESQATTNAVGRFDGLLGTGGRLVAMGGTDIATGKAFTGLLSAPSGSRIINPLTTLVSALVGDTQGLTAEEVAARVLAAEEQVVSLLGLDPAFGRVTQVDPLAIIRANTGDTSAAVQAQLAAVSLANVLLTTTAALLETGVAATIAQAGALVAAGLRAMAELNAGGVADLSAAAVVKQVFDGAVEAATSASAPTVANFDSLAQQAAEAVANVNAAVAVVAQQGDPADGLTTIVKATAVQLVVVDTGGLIEAVKAAAQGVTPTIPTERFTTEAVLAQQEANEEKVQDVDGDADGDARFNGPTAQIEVADTSLGRGESTTVTITFSEAVRGFEIGDLSAENGRLSNLRQDAQNPLVFRATLQPAENLTDTTNVVRLANTYTDLSGNAGAPAQSNNFEVRTAVTADTPTQTASITAINDNASPQTGLVAAGGFTNDTTPTLSGSLSAALASGQVLEVFNGTSKLGNAVVNGTSWTFTPAAALTDGEIALTARVLNTNTNAAGVASEPLRFTVDTQGPTAPVIQIRDNELTAGESTLVLIAFSEPVENLSLADFAAQSGTLSNLARSSTNPLLWTATLTPSANTVSAENVVTLAAGSYTDRAGNTGEGATSPSYSVNTRPSATTPSQTAAIEMVADDVGVTTGSVALGGVTDDNLPIVTGTLSAPLQAGQRLEVINGSDRLGFAEVNGTNWSFSRPSGLVDGLFQLAARVVNEAGEVGATSAVYAFTVDTVAPKVLGLTLSDTDLRRGESATLTVTLTEAVQGLSLEDFALEPGNAVVLSALTGPRLNDDGSVSYALTVNPNAELQTVVENATIRLLAGGYRDDAGNAGGGITSSSFRVDPTPASGGGGGGGGGGGNGGTPGDTTPPGLPTINPVAGDNIINASEQQTAISGTAEANSTVLLSLGGRTRTVTANAQGVWSYNLVADDITGMGQGPETLTVRARDAAGNESQPATRDITVDTVAPAAPGADTLTYRDNLGAVQNNRSTAPSTDDATPGLNIGVLPAGVQPVLFVNGVAVAALYDASTGSLTPTTPLPDGPVELSYAFRDAAGNTSDRSSVLSLRIRTEVGSPTAVLVAENADGGISANEASDGVVVTVNLPANAVVGDRVAVSIDGSLPVSVTLTAGQIAAGTVLVTLPVADINAAGQGAGTVTATIQTPEGLSSAATTAMVVIDTVAPRAVSITVSDTTLTAGETATVEIRFSEAVQAASLTVDDFEVGSGTLSNLVQTADPLVWTATLTPTANTVSTTNTVSLKPGGYTDLVGNAGLQGSSANYTVDTTPPPEPVAIAINAIGDDTRTTTAADADGDFITSDRTITVLASTSRELAANEVLQIRVVSGTASTGAWTDAVAHPTLTNGWFVSSEMLNVLTGGRASAAFDLGTDYRIESRVITVADKAAPAGTAVTPRATAEQALQIVANTNPVASSQGGADLSLAGVDVSALGITGATGQRFVLGDYENNLKVVRVVYTVQLDSKQLAFSQALADELGLSAVLRTTSTLSTSQLPGALPVPLSGGTTSTLNITATDGGVVDVARVNELLASLRLTGVNIPGLPPGVQLNTTGVSVQSNFTLTVSDQGLDADGNLIAPQTAQSTSTATLTALPAAGFVEGSVAGNDAVTGTANSEFVFGYNGDDTLNGDAGDDVLRGGGGNDSLLAGAGNDTLVLDLDSDDAPGFGRDTFEGGEGTDTLRVEGQGTINFVATAEADGSTSLSDLEVIDLGKGNGAQTIVLNELLVSQITGNGNQLTVFGDQADRLIFTPGSVASQRTVIGPDGNAFVEYTLSNDKLVLVEDGVRVSIETPPPPPVDNTPPTAMITISPTTISSGQTATVTITFSEAVEGFALTDLNAPNGTLSALSVPSAGEGSTVVYTATFTPTPNTSDDTNLITLTAGSVTDRAGNALGAAVTSANYTVNTVTTPTPDPVPSQMVVITAVNDNVAPLEGEVANGGFTNDTTPTLTGTLSTALGANEVLRVFNGEASLGTATVNATTWTFTPPAALAQGAVSLSARVVNTSTGQEGPSSAVFGITVDTQAPVAPTIVLSDTALTAGETAEVTITFSEPVNGFELADLVAENGTLSNLSGPVAQANGGVRYTAVFTPAANVSDATNVITIAAGAATDRAGNPTPAGSSANYTVDTTPPPEPVTLAINAIGDDTRTVAGAAGDTDFITSDRTITVFASASRELTANELLQVRVRPNGSTADTPWTNAEANPSVTNGWIVSSEMLNAVTSNRPSAAFDLGNYTIEARVILRPVGNASVQTIGTADPQPLQIVANSAPVASSQGGADLSLAGVDVSALGVTGATGQRFVVGDYENNLKAVRLVYTVQLDSKQLAFSQALAAELDLQVSLTTTSTLTTSQLPLVTSPVPLSGGTTSTLNISAVGGGLLDVARINEFLASLRLTGVTVPGLPAGVQLNTTGVSVQSNFTLSISDEGVGTDGALLNPRTAQSASTATLTALPAAGFVEGSIAGNDAVTGTANSEFLFGFGGDDTLNGDAGDDVLRGGAGNDSLNGGAGNDTLVLNLEDDVDAVGLGRDSFDGGEGTDILRIEGTGSILDLVASANPADGTTTVTGIEVLDLGKGNGSQTVVLDELLVTEVTGNGGQLIILGDQADRITFKPGSVVNTSKRTVIGPDGNAFTEYTLVNDKVVLVEDGVRVVIEPLVQPMGFTLTPIIGG